MCCILIEMKIMHIHYDLYGHALALEPLARGSWNLQFWWTFPSISLLYIHCLTYTGDIFIEIMQFNYMTKYGHAQAQEPLSRGVMKFGVLLDPSLFITTAFSVCLINAQE